MTRFNLLLKILILGMAFSSGMAFSDNWQDASHTIKHNTDKIINLLQSIDKSEDQESSTKTSDEIYAELSSIVSPVVDFPLISKSVMAKHYRTANSDQISRFEEVFQTSLLKAYAHALTVFNISDYQIRQNNIPSRREGREKVALVLYSNGVAYEVVYSMRNVDGEWKLYNLTLDGLNLVLTFRNKFADSMQSYQNNIDEVINNWSIITKDGGEL